MVLTGQETINSANHNVWRIFMDTEALARIVPFVSRLEKVDEENYVSVFEVKVGPVKGSFTGSFKMVDVAEPETFKLLVQQNSKIGNANVVVTLNLNAPSEAQTLVSFNGDVKLSGTLATMGGRVLTPIANMLAKQFFKGLEKEVAA